VDVVTKCLILPDETPEIVEGKRVVEEGNSVRTPTDGVAGGCGLGVFDPEAGGFVKCDIVFASSLPLRRWKI
jgi:hypothetical protein